MKAEGTQIRILSLLKHSGVKVVSSKVFVTNDKVLAFFKSKNQQFSRLCLDSVDTSAYSELD